MRLSSILTAAALVAVGTSAFAQASYTVGSQQAGAKIMTAITIEGPARDGNGNTAQVGDNEMWFGRFITGLTQTVTLNPNTAGRDNTTASHTVGTDYYMPTYTVKGSSGEKYTITLPPTTNVTIGTGTGVPSMTVSNFTYSLSGLTTQAVNEWTAASSTSPATALAFTEANGFKLRLGATLTIPVTAAVGTYQGTYTLTVAYN